MPLVFSNTLDFLVQISWRVIVVVVFERWAKYSCIS